MKVYKVTLMVVDHDEVGTDLQDILETTKYPNRCIEPHVIDIESREIGEWYDSHPLNIVSKIKAEFLKLFDS